MGCASSSPLINGGGPGGVVESAKEAATKTANDVLHAGEAAIHDVGEHVKDAVQNVTHELENVLGGGGGKKDKSDTINEDDQDGGEDGGAPMSDKDYQIIRLKGSKQNSVDSETLENMKNDMMTKAQQSFGEDPERMADDLMRETEELMRDAETGIAHTRQQVLDEMTTRITSTEDEPEIERILADAAGTDGTNGHDRPASPKATLNTLAVPATATVATNGDEGMMPMMANKPDVFLITDTDESIRLMQQGSCDDSDRMSQDNVSNGSEERFLSEVQKATSTHTPGRATVRRATPVNRQPPPCTSSTRVQQFIFKLNSIILSDIEERADEDGGNIVRQLERNPEKVVELLSHSGSLGDADGLMDEGREPDARKRSQKSNSKQAKAAGRLRRQQSVAVEENDINPPVTLANGEPDVTQSNEGNSAPPTATFAGIVQLQDIPPAVRLRALMRFKSLDSFRTETEHDNGGSDGPRRGRAVYGTCQPKSLDAIDDLEEAEELSSSVEVSYDAEEEERICGELLTELRALEEADRAEALESNATPNENETSTNGADDDGDDGEVHKTAWEKLQDYLQRVPKRRDSEYDLFCGNEEDVLKMLFKRQKIKLLFHFSDSSSSSTDTL